MHQQTHQVKNISASGQISLGKEFAGRAVSIEEPEPGVWELMAKTRGYVRRGEAVTVGNGGLRLVLVGRQLRGIFAFRRQAIERIFA